MSYFILFFRFKKNIYSFLVTHWWIPYPRIVVILFLFRKKILSHHIFILLIWIYQLSDTTISNDYTISTNMFLILYDILNNPMKLFCAHEKQTEALEEFKL